MRKYNANEYLLQDFLNLISVGNELEQNVIKRRFGLPIDREFTPPECSVPFHKLHTFIDCEPHTIEQIEREFGITRQRIRQTEAKFFYRHPQYTRIKRLKDYLE